MTTPLPPLDSSALHVGETGKPTKDFYNWIKSISDTLRPLSQKPAFSVHKNSTDQTGIADSTPTPVTWSTELYDTGGYFSSNVWTPPAGKIHLSAACVIGGTIAAGALSAIWIFKNGSAFKEIVSPAATNLAHPSISIDDLASGTDTYGVVVFIDVTSSTGTVAGDITRTFFMGHWLGS